MELITFLGGVVIGISIFYLVYSFCKYKYWIRETSNEERESYKKEKK